MSKITFIAIACAVFMGGVTLEQYAHIRALRQAYAKEHAALQMEKAAHEKTIAAWEKARAEKEGLYGEMEKRAATLAQELGRHGDIAGIVLPDSLRVTLGDPGAAGSPAE